MTSHHSSARRAVTVEPSQNYGDQYLQIAGSYLKNWVQQ